VDSDFAVCAVAASVSCVVVMGMAEALGKGKAEANVTLNQCQVLPKPLSLIELLKSFFYARNTGKCVDWNILNS
jgi:hypothetical protein